MKVIIAGSRSFNDYELMKEKLNTLDIEFSEIVSGTAGGADKLGERLAKEYNIPLKQFPADWNNLDKQPCKIGINKYGYKYNVLAGHNRNLEMAKYADALVAFSVNNSSGTANMIENAKNLGLQVFEL